MNEYMPLEPLSVYVPTNMGTGAFWPHDHIIVTAAAAAMIVFNLIYVSGLNWFLYQRLFVSQK